MSGFAAFFASVMCLLVILTGPSSALFWRPAAPTVPTYPPDTNDPYYQAFQTVPSPSVTAKKLMTNFLGYSQAGKTKRLTIIEDIVIVLDGSASIGSCEFKKGKEALKHMMTTARNPSYDTKYAAVTFGSTAQVNFKFSPYSSAASKITKIAYPDGGSTNTPAGLTEAKGLFDDSNSGRRLFPDRKMVFLVTDGQSGDTDSTVRSAKALKDSGVKIFVVGVGNSIYGIDEMVKAASYPPDEFLFRVKNLDSFWNIIKLIVKEVSPGKYSIVNYDPPCL
ncbi:hypothetical protein ACROYT_G006641 [Oculina patagonica]